MKKVICFIIVFAMFFTASLAYAGAFDADSKDEKTLANAIGTMFNKYLEFDPERTWECNVNGYDEETDAITYLVAMWDTKYPKEKYLFWELKLTPINGNNELSHKYGIE